MDVGGTSPWTGEGRTMQEHDSREGGVRVKHDCMDAGGRATHGAVAEEARTELSRITHDCRDAGGKATQETKPRNSYRDHGFKDGTVTYAY